MKSPADPKAELRKDFDTMNGLEDFVTLLNKAIRLHSGQSEPDGGDFIIKEYTMHTHPKGENGLHRIEFKTSETIFQITAKDLLRYALPDAKRKTARYVTFEIPKKSGKTRTIHAPVRKLKLIQKVINLLLNAVFEPNKAATGFVAHKSIMDNALLHTSRKFVFNIDLEDFFPSIDQARIWKRLQFPPFNLGPDRPRRQIADVIAGLCCYTKPQAAEAEAAEMKTRNVLPQGAPTSPTITNIICERLDRKLTGLAKKHKLRYSRYADDISFSSDHYVYSPKGDFQTQLRQIIEGQGFRINEAKTRLQKPGYRQEVTGLTVNEKPNVPQRYLKQLRRWLHIWETKGYEAAQEIFVQEYMDPKKGRGYAKLALGPQLCNVLDGKLNFLKMVKGDKNPAYRKLLSRFDDLRQEFVLQAESVGLRSKLIKTADAIIDKPKVTLEELHLASEALEMFQLVQDNSSSLDIHNKAKALLDKTKDYRSEENPVVVTAPEEIQTVPKEEVSGSPALRDANPKLFDILDRLAYEGIEQFMKNFK